MPGRLADFPKCLDAPSIQFVPRKIQSALIRAPYWHQPFELPASRSNGISVNIPLTFANYYVTLRRDSRSPPPAQVPEPPSAPRTFLFHAILRAILATKRFSSSPNAPYSRHNSFPCHTYTKHPGGGVPPARAFHRSFAYFPVRLLPKRPSPISAHLRKSQP